MNAIVFKQTGNWLDVLQSSRVTIDNPLPDEVRVRIYARPINPADEMFIQGVYRYKPELPQVAGLEGAGIIESCGSDVDPSLVGKKISFRARGTWTDRINLKKNQFKIIPEEIPFEVSCQLSLNTLTAFALLEEAKVSTGDWMVVTAAFSSVGQQLIQMARVNGIHVIAIVRKDEQKKHLQLLGAHTVINSEKEEILQTIRDVAQNGINACVDAVGGKIGSLMYKVLALKANVIIYGRLSSEPVSFHNADIIYKNATIKGFGIDAWMNGKTETELNSIWETILQWIQNQKLTVHYDKKYELNEVLNAIKDYKDTSSRIILM